MTRPFDRNALLPQRGEVNWEAGEFWVQNPFMMTRSGFNLSAYERNKLYLNVDGERFLDASFASGADMDSDSRAVVAADFNRDGAPDLLVSNAGGGSLRLLLNRFPDANRRATLRLVGVESNRQGIGARVIAQAGERCLVRDLFPANGCLGQSPAELNLGLGAADKIDLLTIRWPTGQEQVLRDLPVGGMITITEGSSEPEFTAWAKSHAGE